MLKMSKNKKTSPQNKSPKSLDLTMYEYIRKHKNLKQIMQALKISKKTLYYHISKLKKEELIQNIGYATWQITPKQEPKKRSLKPSEGTPHRAKLYSFTGVKTRAHSFQFLVKVVTSPRWLRREQNLIDANIMFKRMRSRGGGQSLEFDGFVFHLRRNAVIIYDSLNYVTMLANEGKGLVLNRLLRVLRAFEEKTGLYVSMGGKYHYRVTKEHYALLDHPIAKHYKNNQKKLIVSNPYGKWLETDFSLNIKELEIHKNRDPNTEQAVTDTEGVQRFFNQLKEMHWELEPEFIGKTLKQLVMNQAHHEENIRSHVDAIKEMTRTIKELKEVVYYVIKKSGKQ